MIDLPGEALYDYYFNLKPAKLWIHNKYGPKEEMPVPVYFRKAEEMPDLELIALENCEGKVLDIGAGSGSHALLLQQKGLDVTALEISAKAGEIMKHRGVEKIIVQDVFEYAAEQFDTLLLLMNGIGLAGDITGLQRFLQHAKKLLKPGGQLLFDSSDVAYLYEGSAKPTKNYYGEIMYRYQYKKLKTDWFIWLYIDKKTLEEVAGKEGWQTEILFQDEYEQYLAKLTYRH